MTQKAFQDYIQKNDCWGCGPNNENGLRIKSYWSKENENETILTFNPSSYHKAGPDHILNGGIISTIIDCHGIFTAVAQTARDDQVEINDDLWYVTGTLKVIYLKPTPINKPVELRAKVVEKKGKKSVIEVSLYSEGVERVKGEVIGIKIAQNNIFYKTTH